MSLTRTPIEASQLSADAQRALGSGPAKMMAARGMAPLANPVDLVTVMYQLSVDSDQKIREAAVKSASDLPDRVLEGALADPSVDPRVIDFFAEHVKGRATLIEVVVLNNAAAGETVAALAASADEKLADLIAQNEKRLLETPAIIGALYTNRRARMSTVDRVVELAVLNEVKVPGIAAWDEVCKAILESGKGEAEPAPSEAMDAVFAAAATVSSGDDSSCEQADAAPVVEAEQPNIRDLSVPMKIRLATLGTKFERAALIRDTKKMVAMAAIKSPGVGDAEAAKYAGNSALSDEVIGYIANRREWVKQYNVKLALVQNPKCPLPSAMRLMTHLREKDIRLVARSKGVPTALAAQARRLLAQKAGGGKK